MSSVEVSSESTAGTPPVNAGEFRLEVVVLPVSDVSYWACIPSKTLLRTRSSCWEARRRSSPTPRLGGGSPRFPMISPD